MQMRRIVGAYLVGLSGAVASTLPAQTLPRPVVSLSLATPLVLKVARDSVDLVIRWTSACSTTATRCPTRFFIAAVGGNTPHQTMVAAGTDRRATLRIAKPVCPLTERMRVGVVAGRDTSAGPAGVATIAVRCRLPNAIEKAHADSFPKANHRITLCSKYGEKISAAEQAEFREFNLSRAKTAQDSGRVHNEWEAIRLGPDSLYTPQTHGDTVKVLLGYKYPVAMLLKNRYTGKVRTEDGVTWTVSDPNIAKISAGSNTCQQMIDAWESERDS